MEIIDKTSPLLKEKKTKNIFLLSQIKNNNMSLISFEKLSTENKKKLLLEFQKMNLIYDNNFENKIEILINNRNINRVYSRLKKINSLKNVEELSKISDSKIKFLSLPNKLVDTTNGLVMGILNVSPESFSDGYKNEYDLNSRIKNIVSEGADIIDIGGQSTKMGFEELTVEEEINRITPAIVEIKKNYKNVIISVDSYKYEVIKKSIELGVDIINDVNGFETVEKQNLLINSEVGILTMFNKRDVEIKNVVEDTYTFFENQINNFKKLGINTDRLILDPGIGYSGEKDSKQDFIMMNNINRLNSFNRPILTAISNKGWAKNIMNLPINERNNVNISAETLMFFKGANILRAHDIKSASELKNVVNKLDSSI